MLIPATFLDSDRMLSFRLPSWIYWTLTGLALVGAAAFTFTYDFSELEGDMAAKLLFTVWGGPLTLVIAASLVTWLNRRAKR